MTSIVSVVVANARTVDSLCRPRERGDPVTTNACWGAELWLRRCVIQRAVVTGSRLKAGTTGGMVVSVVLANARTQ